MLGVFSEGTRANMDKLNITAQRYGVKMGWFMWPVNFDPAWLLKCEGFEEGDKQ
jgi:hypothetical protein